MRIPDKVMPKFAGLKEKISGDADNKDLREAILKALPEAVAQTKEIAPYFRASNERETAKRIFDFLKKRVKYKADDYRQVIQLPSAILRPGAIADCKSLSLFTAAILQNLGIPWHFVLASYSQSTIPGHIYVQTDSGIIIDVVWGKFDSEKKPNYRYKMPYKGKLRIKEDAKIGLGAIESMEKWAIRNGIWYSYNRGERGKIMFRNVSPIWAGGRSVILLMIRKNAGGLANFLKQLSIESDGSSPQFKQSSFDKKRKLEILWLENGGNPNDLYNAIDEGAGKTPTGEKFYELYTKAAAGEKLRPDQWVGLVFSGLFGKKYQGETIGGPEPVSTTGTVLATAKVWIEIISSIVGILGTVFLTLTQVRGINDRQKTEQQAQEEIMAEMRRNAEFQRQQQQGEQQEGRKLSNIILIAAGALTLGLIYVATKKKK